MDYEKKYNEALERAKEIKSKILSSHLSTESCKAVSEYIDEIIPELRESEDERIRKDILCFLKAKLENYTAPTPAKSTLSMWIDYLEKQKEQKPLSTEEAELNALAFLSQMDYTCIPPKKEHQNNSDAPENALGGALNSPLDKDKNLDDIAQDYVEAVKEYNPEPTWDLMQTAVCYGYHYREGEEQKPVEWNTNDKAFIKDCAHILDENGYAASAERLLSMFPVKPAEWSEEDENNRLAINKAIWEYDEFSQGDAVILINWLKSLRPHWKPSEEDLENLSRLKGSMPDNDWGNQMESFIEDLADNLKKLI